MIDFLIIGGGIAGLSAAARLSELGSVVVLEAETALGYHTSGRSAALYEANYGKPSTVALNAASLDYHQAAGVLSPRGLLLVGSQDQKDAFSNDVGEMKLSEIEIDEAKAFIPILDTKIVDRAAYNPSAWDIDTDLLLQGFATTVRKNGGIVQIGARVSSIQSKLSGWVIKAGETYEAAQIVNAAGAWGDTIATMAGIKPIGLKPLRRSMGRIPAPGGHDVSSWPMMFGPGEDWYAKPDAGCLLVSPAEEQLMAPHDAYADDMALAEGFARYERHVTEPVTRLLSSWAGLRTFAPDRQLVLGPDPECTKFIWCVGQGGYGMQSSPGASQFLADIVTGTQPDVSADVAAQLRPERLR